jgi:hypothetical protein
MNRLFFVLLALIACVAAATTYVNGKPVFTTADDDYGCAVSSFP